MTTPGIPGIDYQRGYREDSGGLELSDNLSHEQDVKDQGEPGYQPVNVRVENSGSSDGVQYGNYQTIVIPASSATVASVVQLLPRDTGRAQAYVMPVDAPIVISTSQAEATNISNVGGTFPNGGYIGSGWSPKILHNEAVYACNTSTTTTCRVVVMVDRGE